MRSAAFFDLDKTIIAKSSVLAFAGPLYRARLLTRRDVTRSAYAQFSFTSGRADHVQMERMRTYLSALVAGWSTEPLRIVVTSHLTQTICPLVYAEAVALIRDHQAHDREVIIVTSTGVDIAEPIGALLGVDHVLATRMIEQDGHYTGEISDYMYAKRKAEAVKEMALRNGYDLDSSYAYSDSATDVPLLAAVGHPHAVNPDRDLRRIALQRDWPVLEFIDAPALNRDSGYSYLIMLGASLVLVVGLVAHGCRRGRATQ